MWRELISWQYWIYPLVKTPTYLFRSRIKPLPPIQYIFFSNLSLLRGNISISCLYYSTGPHYQPQEFSKKCQSDPTEKPSLESLCPHERAMARQANFPFLPVFLLCLCDRLPKDPVRCSFVAPPAFYSYLLLTSTLLCIPIGRDWFIYLPGNDRREF